MITRSPDREVPSFNAVPNRMFLLQCSNCGKEMRYKENLNNPRKQSDIGSKKKRCMFCGKTFKVRGSIKKEII